MFEELLNNKKDAIVRRWLDDALAMYPKDSSAAFRRQKDPFANPVGHSLREGTQGIFGALLDGMDDEKIREHLRDIVKIRAVQQFSAAQAVGFVFCLRQAIRAELTAETRDPGFLAALEQLDAQIDQIALMAFEIFVQCREKVCELRVNEVKRRVSWVLDKMAQRSPDSELVQLETEGD